MRRILAAIDFSDVSERVVREAATLAAALKLPLRLLHITVRPIVLGPEVIPLSMAVEGNAEERMRQATAEMLIFGEAVAESANRPETIVLEGSPADAILQQARDGEACIIVMGSHGHGSLYHLFVGSVTLKVIQEAPCPVLVVRSQTALHAAVQGESA